MRQQLSLGALIFLALLLRAYLAVSTAYIWDEDREWIPLGHSISFSGEDRHLPWRSVSHPALSAYIVKGTSTLLGDHPIGNRIGFVLAGTIAILALSLLAWEWLGFRGAMVTALLMTFNEYHLAASIFATEKSPYLMCSALALLFFGRFLMREQPRHLYLAAASAGLAFLFKETSGLLLPVFAVALLATGRGHWLRRRETFIAVGIGGLVVLPDLAWNVAHWNEGFGLHAGRIDGVGFTQHYLLFFGRDLARDLAHALGQRFFDPVDEYPAMSAGWGALMIASAVMAAWMWKRLEPVGRLATICFWFVLLFFTLSKPEQPRLVDSTLLMVDTKVWFWVDLTVLAGSLLGAWAVIRLARRWRPFALGALVILTAVSSRHLFQDKLALPSFSIAMTPSTIWPADGKLVDVRGSVQWCQICDSAVRLVGVRVDRLDGRGPSPAMPEEITAVQLGADDRDFQVLAVVGAEARRLYFFDYVRPDDVSRRQVVSARVNVGSRQILAPFWLH